MARKRRWPKKPKQKDLFVQYVQEDTTNLVKIASEASHDIKKIVKESGDVTLEVFESSERELEKADTQLNEYEIRQREYWHKYLDLTYIAELIGEELPIDLWWVILSSDNLQQNELNKSEQQAVHAFQSKLSQPYTNEIYLDLLQTIGITNSIPVKLRSIMRSIEWNEMHITRKDFLNKKIRVIESSMSKPMRKEELPKDVWKIFDRYIKKWCTDKGFESVCISYLDRRWNVYNDTWWDLSIEQKRKIRQLMYLLPRSAKQIEYLRMGESQTEDPMVLRNIHQKIDAALVSSDAIDWKDHYLTGLHTHGIVLALFTVLFDETSDMMKSEKKLLKKQVYKLFQALPKDLDEVTIVALCEKIWESFYAPYAPEHTHFMETIWNMREVFTKKNRLTLNRFQKVFVDHPYSNKRELEKLNLSSTNIISFFDKLKQSIDRGNNLEAAIVKSLPNDKETNKSILSEKAFDWFVKIQEEYVQNMWTQSWVVPSYNKRKMPHNSKTIEQISLDTSRCNEKDVLSTLYSLFELWFDWADVLRVPWYEKHISVEKFCQELINNFFDAEEKFEKQFELLTHCVKLGEESVLQTSLWKDFTNSSKNIEEQDHYFWKTYINSMRRLATKLNRGEFVDAILDLWFQRSYHTEWLENDFTQDKFDLLNDKFEYINRMLTLNTYAAKRYVWSLYKKHRENDKIKTVQEFYENYVHIMRIDFYNINWKSIVHHLINDMSLTEERFIEYLKFLGDDFDVDKYDDEELTSFMIICLSNNLQQAKILLKQIQKNNKLPKLYTNNINWRYKSLIYEILTSHKLSSGEKCKVFDFLKNICPQDEFERMRIHKYKGMNAFDLHKENPIFQIHNRIKSN